MKPCFLFAPCALLTLAGCRSQAPTAPTPPLTVEKAQPEISVASIAQAAPPAAPAAAPTVAAPATPVATTTPIAAAATPIAATATPIATATAATTLAPTATSATGAATGANSATAASYRVRGQVVQLPAPGGVLIVVKHESIPGFMPAMQMRMALRNAADAAKLKAGDKIVFNLSRDDTKMSEIAVLPPATTLKLTP